MISHLDLQDFRKKYSKELSLGTKRKLSLALALACDSELIFLDEPTSGMDPASRKRVWSLLLEIKAQKKSIIWTTHHLEEAEEIADRIGILSKGKMLIVGTVEEVKKEFGMGHILTISKKSKEKNMKTMVEIKENLVEIIEKYNKKSKIIESQINDEFLKFLLPNSHEGLSKMLKEMEENFSFLQFSLEMNSLEDAFINIGLQNSPHLQNILNDLHEDKPIIEPQLLLNPRKPTCLFIQQVWAIFLHRILLFSHDIASSIAIFIVHLCYLIAIILICRYLILDYPDISYQEKTQYISKLILSAYILLSTLFLGHHVIERELYVKYVMIVMGCKISAYWLGNFCFDFLIFSTSFALMTIVIFASELWIFTNIYGSFAFLLITFGISLIFFAYICSFIFRSYHSAAHFFPLIIFLTFAIPYLLIYLFEEGVFPENREKAQISREVFQGIFLIFTPLYLVERGVSLLGVEEIKNTEEFIIKDPNLVAMVLIFQSLLWVFLLLSLENQYLFNFQGRKQVKKYKNLLENSNKTLLLQEFSDKKKEDQTPLMDIESLKVEREKLLSFSPQDLLKIFNLHKKYKKDEEILKGIDFCVSENQIFALLGPNGAGKTTTFNILTSLIEKDSGLVLLDNKLSSISDFYTLFQKADVGLCPQFNGLWENLTIKEHLLIYGLLKGLNYEEIRKEYEEIVKELDLTSFVKRKAKDLSGGNKRKLCVGLALLGFPKIIFMDEPSTGIDPISKRLLWNLLKKRFTMKKCCVILTTHSMNEAEFLGTKIGILIDGQFFTVNNLQAMKSKYTEGYRIIVKIKKEEEKERVREEIAKKFGGVEEEKNNRGDLNYIVKEGEKWRFSETVAFLEEKFEGVIEDFAISYCSLEEIFLRMANAKVKD